MKTFLDEDFMLHSQTAKKLYHDYAEKMPIIDFHCHLSPKEIAEDKTYENITEVWLGGDHYKWRLMRAWGVDEKYVTGDSTDREKFDAFARVVPYMVGNPMYHWTHLELKRYFGIDELLKESSADEIWEKCNEKLHSPDFSARKLIEKSNVTSLCTTDDPCDDLKYHEQLAADDSFKVKILPAFRPDKSFNIDRKTFIPWIKNLEEVTGKTLNSLEMILSALEERIDFFHDHGCRLSDHALDTVDYISPYDINGVYDYRVAEGAYQKGLRGDILSSTEIAAYKGAILNFLGRCYAKRGWTMQIHIGALRDTNRRMYDKLGPDTGFDAVHDSTMAPQLKTLMDDLASTDELPKTILYNLNPRDNLVLAVLAGDFQGDGIRGKIQFGSAWWFCDHKDGMTEQLKTLADVGMLASFVGMLTDSRSFLSYTRHEYFRRILCEFLGKLVEDGEYPEDMERLGQIVQGVCYDNAKSYFGWEDEISPVQSATK